MIALNRDLLVAGRDARRLAGCAEHARSLGSESLLLNLMEVKS